MAVNPVEVRLAKLEGSYEQIDRRLGSIEDRLGRLETKVDTVAAEFRGEILELRRDVGAVNGRVHTVLYGIIIAVLVPILIRIFFP